MGHQKCLFGGSRMIYKQEYLRNETRYRQALKQYEGSPTFTLNSVNGPKMANIHYMHGEWRARRPSHCKCPVLR